MKKIISLFQRNYNGDRLVRNEIVPGAEWVLEGEGWATRKLDGTCCLIRDGKLFKRYEIKKGKEKTPEDFEPADPIDEITGKQQGWVPVRENNPSDKWHIEAFRDLIELKDSLMGQVIWDGTYELIGPKIQGNPEKEKSHILIRHKDNDYLLLENPPKRDFESIKNYLANGAIEGIVWHHQDGRMVKIKAKDFGFKRV